MNQEQKPGQELGKHISMELIGDAARVTNVVLQGSKLVLTIEADLTDSQLVAHGGSAPTQAAGRMPRGDTRIVSRKDADSPATSGAVPDLGAPLADAALAAGPAPVDSATAADFSGSPFQNEPASPFPLPSSPSARVGEAPAPGINPLEALDETPDLSLQSAPNLPAGNAGSKEIRMDDGFAAAAPEPAPAPAPASAAKELRLGGEISLGDDMSVGQWQGGSQSASASDPQLETWDPTTLATDNAAPADSLAMTEESSVMGGERHGEPQPAISFGMDSAPTFSSQTPVAAPVGTTSPGIMLGEDSAAPFGQSTAAGSEATFGFGATAPAPGISLGGDQPLGFESGPTASTPAPGISLGSEQPLAFETPPQQPAPAAAPGISLGGDPGISLGSEQPLAFETPAQQPTPAAAPGISLGGDPGISLGSEQPLAFETPPQQPAPAAAPGISLGGDPGISLGSEQPLTFETPPQQPAPAAAPGISLGGDPGISLGSEQPLAFETPPQQPAPAAAPGISLGGDPGISLGNEQSLAFEPAAPQTAPAAAPGISLGGDAIGFGTPPPAAGPSFGLGAEAPLGFEAPPAAPAPALGIGLGGDAPSFGPGEGSGVPAPAFGFGGEPPAMNPASDAPQPAPLSLDPPAPAVPPLSGTAEQEAPTLPNLRPAQPEAPSQPPPAPAGDGRRDGKGEPGGTTVLIRYTCPKCKTQGMQAVDKVNTVVNCSNCGKAMRLVMKK